MPFEISPGSASGVTFPGARPGRAAHQTPIREFSIGTFRENSSGTDSLRHINHLKRLTAARRAEYERRQRLWSLMYADPTAEQRNLDEREADLDGREQELRLRELQADIGEPVANAKVSQQRKDHLYQMAMWEIGRRRKKAGATSS